MRNDVVSSRSLRRRRSIQVPEGAWGEDRPDDRHPPAPATVARRRRRRPAADLGGSADRCDIKPPQDGDAGRTEARASHGGAVRGALDHAHDDSPPEADQGDRTILVEGVKVLKKYGWWDQGAARRAMLWVDKRGRNVCTISTAW